MSFHTTVDVAGLKAARPDINGWARWGAEHGGPLEGNRQMGGEGEEDLQEVIGLDDVVLAQFEELARAAGMGILEFLVTIGIAEIERRSGGAAG